MHIFKKKKNKSQIKFGFIASRKKNNYYYLIFAQNKNFLYHPLKIKCIDPY